MSRTKVTAIPTPPDALNRCFALADCNNFFASCERVCNPKLKKQPVVVLSSNDGCIVARSNEAKMLGIGMGKPFFQCRDIIEKHKVNVFSSNFSLYGDMSRRVMSVLTGFVPEIEIYSIDEAFLNLRGCDHLESHNNLTEYARTIRNRVSQWTGIPVSIGIARTKTLAKVAAHLAKRSNKTQGVLDLIDSPFIDQALERVEVGEVWGVGWQTTKWLMERQITNARQLRDIDDKVISKRMGVMGLRLVNELRGVSCFSLGTCPPASKTILSSQSFGQKTSSLEAVKGAVANHITIAAKKLRDQQSAVKVLIVFLLTKHYGKEFKRASHSTVINLPKATNNTAELIHYAMLGTDEVFQEGLVYVKAGIMFNDIVPEDQVQTTLFPDEGIKNDRRLIEAIDRINRSMGKRTLQYAVQLPSNSLRAKSEHNNRNYTTNWGNLITVKAR